MTVSFCGHADFRGTAEQEGRVLAFLENKIGDEEARKMGRRGRRPLQTRNKR